MNRDQRTFNAQAWRRPLFSAQGFTLVEILVVVLIMGLLAGAASLVLLHSTKTASMEDAIRRVQYLDYITRHSARHSGQGKQIEFDITAGVVIARDESTSLAGSTQWFQQVKFPEKFQLERVWSATGDEAGQKEGVMQIPCSAQGYTPTYALQLLGAEQHRRWIIIAGLTGEMSECPDAQHIDDVWKMIQGEVADQGTADDKHDDIAVMHRSTVVN